jgi:hypothetical protein
MTTNVNNNYNTLRPLDSKQLDDGSGASTLNLAHMINERIFNSEGLKALIAKKTTSSINLDSGNAPENLQAASAELHQLVSQIGDEHLQSGAVEIQNLQAHLQDNLTAAINQPSIALAQEAVKTAAEGSQTQADDIYFRYISPYAPYTSGGSAPIPRVSDGGLSAILNYILNNKNVNIMLVSALLFLAIAQNQQDVISVDGQLAAHAKQDGSDINSAIAAFAILAGLIPYRDANGNEVTSFFELYRLAFGSDNPQYASLKAKLQQTLPFFTKALDENGKPIFDDINWTAGDLSDPKKLFNSMFTKSFQRLNDDSQRIDTSLPPIPKFSIDGEGNYIINDKTPGEIQNFTSVAKDAVTSATNVSNNLYAQMQADTTAYQQNFQGAIKFIEALSQLSNTIWAR